MIVLSCQATASTGEADADVEAVHAFTRCVRLEYPRRVINTVLVAPDELKAVLPRILQGQAQPDTLWRAGQPHIRHIHALDAADASRSSCVPTPPMWSAGVWVLWEGRSCDG